MFNTRSPKCTSFKIIIFCVLKMKMGSPFEHMQWLNRQLLFASRFFWYSVLFQNKNNREWAMSMLSHERVYSIQSIPGHILWYCFRRLPLFSSDDVFSMISCCLRKYNIMFIIESRMGNRLVSIARPFVFSFCRCVVRDACLAILCVVNQCK